MFQLSSNRNDRKTAIYVRISTGMQKTDRQVTELLEYANSVGIRVNEEDIFVDIISGFKDGEIRPKYSDLKRRIEDGEYQQILFSEFSRLDRKPSNLLKSIEYYQNRGVFLYFRKQGIWVKDKTDISTQIMISVLAVMSQYEIELFVARGIDGKVSALKNRGINCGGLTGYGYTTTPENKKLIVNEKEAEVVRRIFNYFLEGKSSLQIADILNSEGIPTAYKTRIAESKGRRKAKGLPEKKYAIIQDSEQLKWRASTINRLIKCPIYIGHRDFKFYEPDPSNPLPVEKRTDRKLLTEFSTESSDLCIVDPVVFEEVNRMVNEKKITRNLGIRHENLLKHLMRCGNCGSKFSVSGGLNQRKYRCYGTASRKYEKERICDKGAELLMRKFDGMVLHLCIRKFADYDAEKSTAATIEYLNREIEDKTRIVSEYKEQLKEETERFSSYVRRVLKTAATDDEVQEWTRNERADYEQKTAEIKKAMARVSRKLAPMKSRLFSLQRMQSHVNILAKQEEILADKNIVSEYVNEFIKAIVTYRIAKIWTLVVIQFVDGSEFWGLGKNARYKVCEMRYYHDQDRDTEYYTWVIDNSAHLLSVDKDTGIISVKPGFDGFISGEYSFAEFDQMVREKGCYGYYSEYQFE